MCLSSPKFAPLVEKKKKRRGGAMHQGWVVKTGKGSESCRVGGVNSRRGVAGVEGLEGWGGENINRACDAEAVCHGPLQEKD